GREHTSFLTERLAGAGAPAASINEGLRLSTPSPAACGLVENRNGELKMQLKFCHPRDVHEGLFRRQRGNDLIYEHATVFEHRLSLDFLDHDCAPPGKACPNEGS